MVCYRVLDLEFVIYLPSYCVDACSTFAPKRGGGTVRNRRSKADFSLQEVSELA
jgi:hypothetical protein